MTARHAYSKLLKMP